MQHSIVWNSLIACLPPVFTMSLHVLTYLFQQSFPDIVFDISALRYCGLRNGYMPF